MTIAEATNAIELYHALRDSIEGERLYGRDIVYLTLLSPFRSFVIGDVITQVISDLRLKHRSLLHEHTPLT